MSRKRQAKRALRRAEVVETGGPVNVDPEQIKMPCFIERIDFNTLPENQQLILREIRQGMLVAVNPKDPELDKVIEEACDVGISTRAIGQAMSEGNRQRTENFISSFKERGG